MDEFLKNTRLAILDLYWFWSHQLRESAMSTKHFLGKYILSSITLSILYLAIRILKTGSVFEVIRLDFWSVILTFLLTYVYFILHDIAREHRYYRSNISPEQYFHAKPYNPSKRNIMDGIGIQFTNNNPMQIEVEGIYIVAIRLNRIYIFNEDDKGSFIRLPFHKEKKLAYDKQSVPAYAKTIYEMINWEGSSDKPSSFYWSFLDRDSEKLPQFDSEKEYQIFLRCYIHTSEEPESKNRFFRTAMTIKKANDRLLVDKLRGEYREH